jgi:adhesin/invasin
VGANVTITTDGDVVIGSVTDNGNGTYSATINSSATADLETITATAGGVSGNATLTETTFP